MMTGKKVREEEFDTILEAINQGEGFPSDTIESWFKKEYCFHSVHGYFIPQDPVSMKYCDGFEEFELTID